MLIKYLFLLFSDDEFGDKSSSCEEEEEGADQDGTQSPEGNHANFLYTWDSDLVW